MPSMAKTGAKLWEFETGVWTDDEGDTYGGVRSSTGIGSDETVYIGSKDRQTLCLKWQEWGQAMGI